MHPLQSLLSFLTVCNLAFSWNTSIHVSPVAFNTSYGASFDCLKSKDWTKPHWPYNAVDILYSISVRLHDVYVRPTLGQDFEFLPYGEVPVVGLPIVRTPFKLVLGKALYSI